MSFNMLAAQQAIERYNQTSRELASLFRERGELHSAAIDKKVSAYEQAIVDGDNVSNARHASDSASKYFDQELAKINGNIAALEVELRYLDQLLTFTYHERRDDNA